MTPVIASRMRVWMGGSTSRMPGLRNGGSWWMLTIPTPAPEM